MSAQKIAVITGGAGGLGLALDDALRAEEWATVLIDLPGPALDTLPALPGRQVMGCDLTDDTALNEICATLRGIYPAIDLIIYNAGVTHIGALSETATDTHRRVFDINYFAPVCMARALQTCVRQANGTHLAISSVAGFSPLIRRTAYAASKHALEGFFKSLRSEEKPHGVRCVIAAPSFVATNLGNPQQQANGISRPGAAVDGIDYMSAQDAAGIILAGLARGRDFIPVGRVARLSYMINRFSPGLFQRLMEKRIK